MLHDSYFHVLYITYFILYLLSSFYFIHTLYIIYFILYLFSSFYFIFFIFLQEIKKIIKGKPTMLTVRQMKTHLRRRGLPVTGLKKGLQKRLCTLRNLALILA